MGVYGQQVTISRPTGWDCTEVSKPREHWDIGVFLLFIRFKKSIRARAPFCRLAFFYFFGIKIYLSSPVLLVVVPLTVMTRFFRLEFPLIQNSYSIFYVIFAYYYLH